MTNERLSKNTGESDFATSKQGEPAQVAESCPKCGATGDDIEEVVEKGITTSWTACKKCGCRWLR